MTAAEIVQLAIRTSRNENRTVDLAPEDQTQAEALYEELLTESADSCDGSRCQTFWGGGWQICLLDAPR
jgi:predicted 3-demethylubiquinone-9 3-methyltransferase (glyoxalase superfamily)